MKQPIFEGPLGLNKVFVPYHKVTRGFWAGLVLTVLTGCAVPKGVAPFVSSDPDSELTSEFNAHSARVAPSPLPAPPLRVTAEVKQEMKKMLRGDGLSIKVSLNRRAPHYPVLKQIFEDEGIPHELLSLALIESGYNVHARSSAGAVGMWQFMKSTARMYGLTVGLMRDERKDPVLSTIAAARHLRDLYSMYEDWYLALAAYNAGPGYVDRAIRRSGLTDFWSLARAGKLCTQTRRFVPKFIAAAIITSDPVAYGVIDPVEPPQSNSIVQEVRDERALPKAADATDA